DSHRLIWKRSLTDWPLAAVGSSVSRGAAWPLRLSQPQIARATSAQTRKRKQKHAPLPTKKPKTKTLGIVGDATYTGLKRKPRVERKSSKSVYRQVGGL